MPNSRGNKSFMQLIPAAPHLKLNIQSRLLLAFLVLSAVVLAFAALFATQFVTFQYIQHLVLERIDPEHMQGPLGPAMNEVLKQLNGPDRAVLARLRYGILQAGALALALSVLFSYLLSRHITRPIMAMHAVAVRMARGDFSQRVPVTGNDDLNDLARALNTMAHNLEEANRLRKLMVADLAHELRTPLTGLRSYVEAMREGVLPTDKENMDVVLSETLRLQRLVRELHELSLLDANALALELGPVDPAAIIRQVASLHQTEITAKGQRLEIDLPPDLPKVQADADRLAQILHNLLTNAVTHTPEGGMIRISAHLEKPATNRVGGVANGNRPLLRVTVADTGSGIPPEELPFIFERFYRADPSRNRATGGTGLGLTITQKLVEAHGGTISAENRPEGGAVFSFTLPVAVADSR